MRTFVWMTIAVLAVAASVAAGALSAPATGLRGIVWRGPVMPVCEVGVPCERPAAGVTLVFSQNGRVVGRATTGPTGWFSVKLRRGLYSIRIARTSGFGAFGPRTVRVVTGRITRVDIHVDTGIR
jgi:hypothetical protein